MKQIFNKAILIIFLVATAGVVHGQVINVPDKSEKHFAEKYPGAQKVDWSNNVAYYTAKFNMGKDKYKAFYHMDGTWDYTEHNATLKSFPEAVRTSYKNSRIASWKLHSTAIVVNNKGEKLYRIEGKKGIEKIYLFFDEKGKEIKSAPSF